MIKDTKIPFWCLFNLKERMVIKLNWSLINITTLDVITIIFSFSLGFIIAIFLEKKIWPNFNKKYSLGEYAKKEESEKESVNENEK